MGEQEDDSNKTLGELFPPKKVTQQDLDKAHEEEDDDELEEQEDEKKPYKQFEESFLLTDEAFMRVYSAAQQQMTENNYADQRDLVFRYIKSKGNSFLDTYNEVAMVIQEYHVLLTALSNEGSVEAYDMLKIYKNIESSLARLFLHGLALKYISEEYLKRQVDYIAKLTLPTQEEKVKTRKMFAVVLGLMKEKGIIEDALDVDRIIREQEDIMNWRTMRDEGDRVELNKKRVLDAMTLWHQKTGNWPMIKEIELELGLGMSVIFIRSILKALIFDGKVRIDKRGQRNLYVLTQNNELPLSSNEKVDTMANGALPENG